MAVALVPLAAQAQPGGGTYCTDKAHAIAESLGYVKGMLAASEIVGRETLDKRVVGILVDEMTKRRDQAKRDLDAYQAAGCK